MSAPHEQTVESLHAEVLDLRRELANNRASIWAYFQLAPGRQAQAEHMLRDCLPDNYAPAGLPQ